MKYDPDLDKLITAAEAAELLAVTPETLANWRSNFRYPDLPFIRLGGGRAIRYRLPDLRAWIAKYRSGGGGEGST